MVVVDDFNLIRKVSECNKPIILNKLSRLFNAIIEYWEMKRIETTDTGFAW
jgi:hypothetical protein